MVVSIKGNIIFDVTRVCRTTDFGSSDDPWWGDENFTGIPVIKVERKHGEPVCFSFRTNEERDIAYNRLMQQIESECISQGEPFIKG